MRTCRGFLASILAVGTLAGASATVVRADTEIGRLAVVNGEVRVAKTENDKGRKAAPNEPVFNGDIIKTGDSGATKILFTDQSLMDLGPSSSMKVSHYALNDVENRTGTFTMLYGKLRALVTKKVGDGGNVEVRTHDAVMGVRGTEFMIESPRAQRFSESMGTQIVVVSGMVRVAPPMGGPPVVVGAGQMFVASHQNFTAASSNGPSTPGGGDAKSGKKGESGEKQGTSGPGTGVTSVSAEQMQSMTNSIKTEDTTFVNTVQISPNSGSDQKSNTPPLLTGPLPTPPPPGSVPPPPPPPPPPFQNPSPPPPPGNPVNLTIFIH